jgi:curved DNA-binding protein CbpA
MEFDAYESWLGIPRERRPATLYDLLGLAIFESDPSAIEQAARRQISRVRPHQNGPRSVQSKEILSDLAHARRVLSDPGQRAEYDAELRGRGRSRTVAATVPTPPAIEPGDSHPHPPAETPDVLDSIILAAQDSQGSSILVPRKKSGFSLPKTLLSLATILSILFLIAARLYLSIPEGAFFQHRGASQPMPPTPAAKAGPVVPAAPGAFANHPAPVSKPAPASPSNANSEGASLATASADREAKAKRASPPTVDADREGRAKRASPSTAGADRDAKAGAAPATRSTPSKQRSHLAGPSPEQRLANLGLERSGSLYVLKREFDALQKCREAKDILDAYGVTVANRRDIEEKKQRAAFLAQESHNLAIAIDEYNLRMEYTPRRNNIEKDLYNQARSERDAMRAQKIADDAAAAEIRRQLPGPDRVRALDTEINDNREALRTALNELRDTTDAINTTYNKLAKNQEVSTALLQLRAKLGPSPGYPKMLKWIDQAEQVLRQARRR